MYHHKYDPINPTGQIQGHVWHKLEIFKRLMQQKCEYGHLPFPNTTALVAVIILGQ